MCLDEEDIELILNCRDTRKWRLKLLHDKWPNMNTEVACRKMLKCTNKDELRNLGKNTKEL